MTANSAVWVLVDTYDGSILADEVVPLESVNEIARAAARSVQAFALQSERDIDGVRLVWDDEARAHGIRLRTKMRLFGFDTVETVSEEAAREGRNRTARHIAPHMVLAYGAARADLDSDTDRGVLGRLVARVPGVHPGDRGGGMPTGGGRMAGLREAGSEAALRLSDRFRHVSSTLSRPVPAAAAGITFLAAVSGLVGWALFGGTSPSAETPDTAAAAVVVPAPAAPALPALPPAPQAVAAPVPAPEAVVDQELTAPEALPEVEPMPEEYSTVAPETLETVAGSELATVPEAVVAEVPAALAAEAPDATAVQGVGSTAPGPVSTPNGEPHLTGVGPLAGPPAQAVTAPIAQATPATAPSTPAPPPPAGPLGAFLSALP
ncbi:hypothetical protein PDG61_21980 [Mycolicibacterium sp. BiH015]|uniref:hypothetical protein n=1 Tax=Mycolicibacterium sp. BiH015 TaxID=3018808 RepID=UPI0022E885F2|nr:hypothetical protein [Mycolicibacterium sp. BiH015]MDA2893601.1 hypothetical protein [Mycolicibacterium sp. BiH015]